MGHFAVTAVGVDRPGIVAAVTGVLVGAGCNLEDTSMKILRGHFAMMLVLSGPEDLDAASLEMALSKAADEFDLAVTARTIALAPTGASLSGASPTAPVEMEPGEPWRATVQGADRPGIVHRVCALLAERQVNIVDLSTRVVGERAAPLYVMVLDLSVPPGLDSHDLSRRLHTLAAELGVSVTLHRADADVL